MPFDFKKEFKEFYMPKNKPEIVNVPKANYIAVRGKGNPTDQILLISARLFPVITAPIMNISRKIMHLKGSRKYSFLLFICTLHKHCYCIGNKQVTLRFFH